ncbi:LamG domain-containing protein [Patescibacteria group bacterium]|nr:LamG domain-containing protein [Patescibacteria group bacterium]
MSLNQNKKLIQITTAILIVFVLAVAFYSLFIFDKKIVDEQKNLAFNLPKESFILDEENEVVMEWTDENVGEDLIIQSDKKTYFGINESDIYFSISNDNVENQEINLRFLFGDKDANLIDIFRVTEVVINGQKSSQEEKLIQSPTQTFVSKKEIPKDFKQSIYLRDEVKTNTTNYYHAIIKYPTNSKGEFYVEAIGNKGAYGLLDPWYDSSGLVGYWSFDGPDMDWSSTTAEVLDRSGWGNNGDAVNGPFPAIGNTGQALNFDGNNDYVDLGSDNLEWSGALTVSSWHERSEKDLVSADGIVGNWYWNSDANLKRGWVQRYFINTGDLKFIIELTDGVTVQEKNLSFSDTGIHEWYHVVSSFDPLDRTVKMYVNGVLVDSVTGTAGFDQIAYDSPNSMKIGHSPVNSGYFPGKIDEVAIFDRALSEEEIVDLYNLGNRRLKINTNNKNRLTSGLVGNWTFDGADIDWSTNTAIDRSGLGHNGTIKSSMSATSSPVIGKVGQALEFNGVDNYVSIPSDSSLDLTSSLSISAWIKPQSSGALKGTIVSKYYQNSSYTFKYDNYTLQSRFVSGGVSYYSKKSTPLSLNEWQHVMLIWDKTLNDGKARIFVDGSEVSYLSQDALTGDIDITAGSPLYIGDDRTGGTSVGFDGSIDEVSLYNRSLSTSEVTELYNMGARKYKVK